MIKSAYFIYLAASELTSIFMTDLLSIINGNLNRLCIVLPFINKSEAIPVVASAMTL